MSERLSFFTLSFAPAPVPPFVPEAGRPLFARVGFFAYRFGNQRENQRRPRWNAARASSQIHLFCRAGKNPAKTLSTRYPNKPAKRSPMLTKHDKAMLRSGAAGRAIVPGSGF
ncbi:hypothetical protein [Burkholderia sp. S171]|uniref:hypothetical protein n=1 Tax=Burkholderia sp. S171 TaxID=1641860 RepID=UPI00131AF749|nr:hypothetical protein [Burkholderia sp. S171]